MSERNIRKEVDDIISKTLSLNSLDELLSVCLATDAINSQINGCFSELKTYFSTLVKHPTLTANHAHVSDSSDQNDKKEAISQIIYHLYEQKHVKKQLVLFRVLLKLIQTKTIEAKYITESLLTNLKQQKQVITTYIWCKSLEFVKKLIQYHDYKSCRDIFKLLLDIIKTINTNSSIPDINNQEVFSKPSKNPRIESLYEIVAYLLDTDNYFLPRYLAINEIKTVLTFGKDPYNERFHYLFTQYIESFVPIAHLISVSGRDCFLPIIGFSNVCTVHSVWRFNPISCKFNTSGPLPYYKHISKPQNDLLANILRQCMPQMLILNLMSMQQKTKTRFAALEEQFVYAIIDTMQLTESLHNENEIYRIWNNLLNIVHNLTISQNVFLTAIIKQLINKLKVAKFNFKPSRDWLMWYFLQTISTQLVRNAEKRTISEFLIILDLYDLLYKDDEPLPNPDLNSFISVIKFAPLSIWVHLNKKSDIKTIVAPDILKNHKQLLEEIAKNIDKYDGYAFSICINAYSTDNSVLEVPMKQLVEKFGGTLPNANMIQSHQNQTHKPLSIKMIQSLSLHVKSHIIVNVATTLGNSNAQNRAIAASAIDTYARIFLTDTDIFMKYFQSLWDSFLRPSNLNPLPMLYYQNFNILLELIAFRFTNINFNYRQSLIRNINSIYTRVETSALLRQPQIFINLQCALLKLIQTINGSDYYELINNIVANLPYLIGTLINHELEEINKAVVLLISRAIHTTCSDLQPHHDNKDRDEVMRNLLKKILDATPMYFPEHVLESFPKLVRDFISNEQRSNPECLAKDLTKPENKMALKRRVEEDVKRFKDCINERNVIDLFQNQTQYQTFFCVLFQVIADDLNQNINTHLTLLLNYLNSQDPRKLTPILRTFCDYIVVECSNTSIFDHYITQLNKMINDFNLFTFDRFLFTMTFRCFTEQDQDTAFRILYSFVTKFFDNRIKEFLNEWNNYCIDMEWNPEFLVKYLAKFPETFNYDGLRKQLNIIPRDAYLLNYYGNVILRCVHIYDFVVYRFIEMSQANGTTRYCEFFLDHMAFLLKFHSNPISFVYNTLMCYNYKFDMVSQEVNMKKRRLLNLLNTNLKPGVPKFSQTFENYVSRVSIIDQKDCMEINANYYYSILQNLVNRMLDKDDTFYETHKLEFKNPSCHTIYMILIELLSIPLFSRENNSMEFRERVSSKICTDIIKLFLSERIKIYDPQFVYWINAAGLIIANLPQSYWAPIYDYLLKEMLQNEMLNKEADETLLDCFDLYLATEKKCVNKVTLIIALYHAILYHSNANHFSYFISFIKEKMLQSIKTEAHFLLICKLIGPYISKIQVENTILLTDLAGYLYDMILIINNSNEKLYYVETICNFCYHLKYRHIGEAIRDKIIKIVPKLRPELKKGLKYIIPDNKHQQ